MEFVLRSVLRNKILELAVLYTYNFLFQRLELYKCHIFIKQD